MHKFDVEPRGDLETCLCEADGEPTHAAAPFVDPAGPGLTLAWLQRFCYGGFSAGVYINGHHRLGRRFV